MLVLLCFALLLFTDVGVLQIEGKTSHQQKDYTHFIAVFMLLRGSGMEPTIMAAYQTKLTDLWEIN